jgi:hypothetical protein
MITQRNVEFRVIPSGEEGRWYWEVILDDGRVISRGVAETEPEACQAASEAARKAKLIQ